MTFLATAYELKATADYDVSSSDAITVESAGGAIKMARTFLESIVAVVVPGQNDATI